MLSSHHIEIIDIPFLPREIDAATLDDNGRLTNSEELSKASSIPATQGKCQKFSKKTYQLKHALIATPGAFFAISGKYGIAGEGSEGKVKWVQNTHTGTWPVMKVETGKNTRWRNEISYLDEVGELIKENDEHVQFQYHGATGRKNCFLIQGKPGISLYDYVINNINNNFIFKLKIIVNMLAACQRLKDLGIFHGDVKLDNIMLDPASAEVFLIDYGYSEKLNSNKEFEKPPKSLKGSPKYMAPEMLIRYKDLALTHPTLVKIMKTLDLSKEINKLSPEKITMYSLGIVAAELLKLIDPDDESLAFNTSGDMAYLNMDKDILNQLVEFISSMININPDARPDYEAAIKFFSDFSNKLKNSNYASPLRVSMLDFNQMPTYLGGIIYLAVHHSELNNKTISELVKKKNQLERNHGIVSRQAFVYSSKEELALFLRRECLKEFELNIYDAITGRSFSQNQKTPANTAVTQKTESLYKVAYTIR